MPTTFQHFIGSQAPTLPFDFAAYGYRPFVSKLPTALKANMRCLLKHLPRIGTADVSQLARVTRSAQF